MTAAMIERGEGERRLSARRRRLWTVCGVLFAAGLAGGFTLAMVEAEDAWLSGPIPAGWAIALSVLWLVAIVGGTIWYKRVTDELDIRHNVQALAIGACALLLGYPVWWLLWRGGLAGEPSAHILFLVLYGVTIAAYLYNRSR